MKVATHTTVFHNKCICQICTCKRHKCPHSELGIPLQGTSTYGNDYHKHPITVWTKPKDSGPPADRHYDYINSAYREHYPGHPASMRQKLKPRVKDDDSDLPFNGNSEYKTNFGPKTTTIQRPKGKETYAPTNMPFEGDTTYKSDFNKKKISQKPKKVPEQVNFPPGYRFNGDTTYGNSYVQHPLSSSQNYKPIEKIGDKGPHDLNTIYRQDYTDKPMEEPCPILNLPKYRNKIESPYSHYGYNSNNNSWFAKA